MDAETKVQATQEGIFLDLFLFRLPLVIGFGPVKRQWGLDYVRLRYDSWVLSTVFSGLKLDFLTDPVQQFYPGPITMSGGMEKVCDDELALVYWLRGQCLRF